MYVPAWPGLDPAYLVRWRTAEHAPFPLNAPKRAYFYRARNAIYHLFRALGGQNGKTVLVPDYHSGNEVWAIRAAGAAIRYYRVGRNLEPDLEYLRRVCRSADPGALFIIHYLGWPQPVKELLALCQERGMLLIEDCALSLLSETRGRPLGTFGQYAVFCLYKSLPLPHGGLLVQNDHVLEELTRLELKPCGVASVAGRTAELMLEWLRARSDSPARMLFSLKRGTGRVLTALGVDRLPVGEIGFDLSSVNVGISPLNLGLLRRFDYEAIRRRRRENFRRLREKLVGKATLLDKELEEGVCPLFFPILVPDKRFAARALRERGIAAVEFWNYGDPGAEGKEFADARFLRAHVLELPIHQDITPAQVSYMADQVVRLKLYF
ncbi:MAG: DegT/DnrJ/EryC1/StrS family aminotransferase [Candidatus Rokubacteria bacterium]|nr:DegT/DnrJ/EryC1/StrS family aminotransferase [Candidatus Rokubacteria bacterium]